MKYLFAPSMSRADVFFAWTISATYFSGNITGWEAFGCIVVGAIASAFGQASLKE